MRISSTVRNRLVAAASLAAMVLAAGGCTTAKEAEARANAANGSATSCPVEVNSTATGAVRIGWQAIPNANLLVKDKGWIEACLPNVTVTWIKFDSGADVVQGFGSGSVDLATLGSSPATKALSAPLNVDMQVVWIDDVIGAAESLVAKDPAVKTLTDLRGRTIAVPFGSTSHFCLLMALKEAGLTPEAEFPIWVSTLGEEAGIGDVSIARALKAGLTFRPLGETIKSTLAWWDSLPEERRAKARAGLAPEKEAAALAFLKTGKLPAATPAPAPEAKK